jgi:hypothetical protein
MVTSVVFSGMVKFSTLLQRIPSQAVSICCLKFTRKTIRGDRLYQPMVTQLKRYRNLLIFTFGRSLKTFHHTSKILPTTWRKGKIKSRVRIYFFVESDSCLSASCIYVVLSMTTTALPCYHACNFPLHEHSPWWWNSHSSSSLSPCIHFMSTSSINRNHERGCLSDERGNRSSPSIKFTHEVSKTKMSFLDTTTTVKEGNMTTDLYSKPTDKHQYLSPSSCHPKHCVKSIKFSLKKDGKWEQGEPVGWSFFICTPGHFC